MANYSLVSNAVFQPFSYQELSAPLDRQEAYHEKLAEEYDKMSSQADVLEAMGWNDKDRNSDAYRMFKAYSDNLRAEADNLYRNGLNADSRMRLSHLRQNYNSTIVPIQNAWTKREAEAQMQLKAQMADPTLMFSREARNSTIQDYLNNPTGGFVTISGKNIAAQVGTAAQNIAKIIRTDPNGKLATQLRNLDPYTYEALTRKGLTPEEIADWKNHPALKNIVDNVMVANGVTRENLGDKYDSIYNQSLGYAGMGTWQAIGDQSVTYKDNWGTQQDRKLADEIALEKIKHQNAIDLAQKKGEISSGDGLMADVFNRQAGELPLAVADGDIDKAVSNAAAAFGWSKANNSRGYYPGKMTISPKSLASSTSDGIYYVKDFNVDLFKRDGSVKRWTEFSKDVENSIPKNLSKEYRTRIMRQARKDFDAAVNTAKNIGLNPSKGYTKIDVERALEGLRTSGSAGYVNGYNWNHKNGDWSSTAQGLNVREIKSTDHEGKATFDTAPYTLGDLLDTGKDTKINTKGQDVHAFITNLNGQQGVIFTVGKRKFFASAESMAHANSNARQAFSYLSEADKRIKESKRKGISDAEKFTLETEANNFTNTALSLLETAFAMPNSSPRNEVVNSLTPTQSGRIGK